MGDRYCETQRQSRATSNLKDRYQKSQIERCRGTENLKREWETDTVRDKGTENARAPRN